MHGFGCVGRRCGTLLLTLLRTKDCERSTRVFFFFVEGAAGRPHFGFDLRSVSPLPIRGVTIDLATATGLRGTEMRVTGLVSLRLSLLRLELISHEPRCFPESVSYFCVISLSFYRITELLCV